LGKFAEISNIILDYHIICLQETWLTSNNKVRFKNYSVFRNDRSTPRPGEDSMIICKNNLDPILHNIDSNELLGCDITMLSIRDKQKEYYLSLYTKHQKLDME